jgi:hypothetical protein
LVERKSTLNQRRRSSSVKKTENQDLGKRVNHLLEEGTVESLTKGKQLSQDNLKYQWDFYSELAFQRGVIQDKLLSAIAQSCLTDFKFKSWQRVIGWKYSHHPLCTIGSIKQYGGRFNIGEDISQGNTLKTFQAFYLAEDQATAQVEALGSQVSSEKLTVEDVALTNKSSYSCISISGSLDKVIDLTKKSSLTKFVRLISSFTIPQSIYDSAKRLGIPQPTLINTTTLLLDSFLSPSWRKEPAQFDIPANSQIFGQLAHQAGIDGILFHSTKTGKKCLAVFPSNFGGGSSSLVVDDEPPEIWITKIINLNNFGLCEKNAMQIKTKK